MEKKDTLFISIYNDYYSGILTEYQSSIIKMYYDEDLSLGEIAERLNITPQGVRDALKRAEKTLIEMEQKLGLVKKSEKVKSLLEEIKDQVNKEEQEKINEALEILNN